MSLTFATFGNKIRKLFGFPPKPQLISANVSEHRLRYMLKSEQRDFSFRAEPTGVISARCKSCDSQIVLTPDDVLLWFRCPSCYRRSFYPLANMKRDIGFAQADGVPFEYEMFFFKELPAGLHPPD